MALDKQESGLEYPKAFVINGKTIENKFESPEALVETLVDAGCTYPTFHFYPDSFRSDIKMYAIPVQVDGKNIFVVNNPDSLAKRFDPTLAKKRRKCIMDKHMMLSNRGMKEVSEMIGFDLIEGPLLSFQFSGNPEKIDIDGKEIPNMFEQQFDVEKFIRELGIKERYFASEEMAGLAFHISQIVTIGKEGVWQITAIGLKILKKRLEEDRSPKEYGVADLIQGTRYQVLNFRKKLGGDEIEMN